MAGSPGKVVVIGAGMGGLSAAIRLAHAGLEVEVVDRAPVPGGKMRTFDSDAGPVDAGPTVMTLRPVFEELFDSVGARLSDYVTLHREEVLARHWWPDGSTLDLFASREQSADAVGRFAGTRAEKEFRAFCRRSERLFHAFDAPMMRAAEPSQGALTRHVATHPWLALDMAPHRSLAQALGKAFSDRRLAQLFGRYATYVGGSPFQSPALLSLIWHAEEQGVWRVEGGMHRLARALEQLAHDKGVRFTFGHRATRVEIQQGAAAAVHLDSGARLPADVVVFNGDPAALAAGLLGEGLRETVAPDAVRPRSLSAYVWSYAAEPHGPEMVHHNVFFCDDAHAEFDPIARGEMPEDPTLYICAQDRGTGRSPEGLERFEIIMNGPPAADGADPTDEEKETCRTRTFQTLARFGLTFDPRPGVQALTTPRQFAKLFPASDGSLYGRSPHGLTAALKRPTARTTVAGLYLAGGGTHPGAGIPMATLSGRHAAEAILTDRASPSTSPRTAMRGGMSTA
ncbi:methoxyneurosporene dehydrogenase [Rhodovulum sp. BSW8]|uniref:1-hydroxycarotenoid 3,4-desaturase n=1 Tax=Rhodovulum visakhapatnamense TaxID=364297 RepID=A0A4R8FZ18_9RHOB|nr:MULTISPECIES: 1-hydroxycarotenoid 3,4-desaturase CrtD [Rhodovulum]RBO53672.1 methoxyneurosporene dehydrogenase [Rhodovulum sp. BSW8]TDX28878.1 1-hydroxycarotenoid 3,4-desaturase [Rhodovulum visakhapatnamense]